MIALSGRALQGSCSWNHTAQAAQWCQGLYSGPGSLHAPCLPCLLRILVLTALARSGCWGHRFLGLQRSDLRLSFSWLPWSLVWVLRGESVSCCLIQCWQACPTCSIYCSTPTHLPCSCNSTSLTSSCFCSPIGVETFDWRPVWELIWICLDLGFGDQQWLSVCIFLAPPESAVIEGLHRSHFGERLFALLQKETATIEYSSCCSEGWGPILSGRFGQAACWISSKILWSWRCSTLFPFATRWSLNSPMSADCQASRSSCQISLYSSGASGQGRLSSFWPMPTGFHTQLLCAFKD